MKNLSTPYSRVLLSLITGVLLFSACATHRVDWITRIGQYTYDDAIQELGVPDRSATLSDGSIVAEWLTMRGSTYGTVRGFSGWRFQTYDVNQFPDRYLRLVFAPDKKLTKSENFVR